MSYPLRLAAVLIFLKVSPALAACKPADPATLAAARRKAEDAAYKADQAESLAVRSGNPGAQTRAKQARAAADAAAAEVARLECKEPAAADTPFPGLLPKPAP
jgi:hypothetical protein